MKVDGKAFRNAREEIRKNAPITRGTGRQAAIGTQAWLAAISTVRTTYCKRHCGDTCKNQYQGKCEQKSLSIKTIQDLEKGKASPDTINAVSPHLGINGWEYVEDFGKAQVSLQAPNVIDLRSQRNRFQYPDDFQDTPLMLTVDPILIELSEGDLYSIEVQRMNILLRLGTTEIKLRWFQQVELVQEGNGGWLGHQDGVTPFTLTAPAKGQTTTWKKSIMFVQEGIPDFMWQNLLDWVIETNEKLIQIELEVVCRHFAKRIYLGIVVAYIKELFNYAKEKLSIDKPARFHSKVDSFRPDALEWKLRDMKQ